MRETWYVLEDDSVVHPGEVTTEADGSLTHKSGKVAMRGDVPSTRGVEVDEETGKRVYDGPHDHLHADWPGAQPPFGGKGDHDGDGKTGGAKKPEAKDEKPEPSKAGYKTREQKAK